MLKYKGKLIPTAFLHPEAAPLVLLTLHWAYFMICETEDSWIAKECKQAYLKVEKKAEQHKKHRTAGELLVPVTAM